MENRLNYTLTDSFLFVVKDALVLVMALPVLGITAISAVGDLLALAISSF